MSERLTNLISLKLDDGQAEQVRLNHHQVIRELQQELLSLRADVAELTAAADDEDSDEELGHLQATLTSVGSVSAGGRIVWSDETKLAGDTISLDTSTGVFTLAKGHSYLVLCNLYLYVDSGGMLRFVQVYDEDLAAYVDGTATACFNGSATAAGAGSGSIAWRINVSALSADRSFSIKNSSATSANVGTQSHICIVQLS